MRRRPEQAVVEPREAMAGGQNWAASPVSSHGLPRHDAGFFHRK
jgi:hypothetical protein